MEYFFTADTHFGHSNIIKYCNRPFKNIGEMDYRLVQLWNERVKPEDTIFHIGDFCFKEEKNAQYYIDQLHGKIIFLRGNHDTNNGLKTCIQDIRIYLGGKNILLIHNPNETSYGFDLCLAGHIHQKWKFKTMRIEEKKYKWDVANVGVDVWNFRPITINEIIEAYEAWKREKRAESLSLYTSNHTKEVSESK